MNYEEILQMPVRELMVWLINEFSTDCPEMIATIDDMDNASKILLKLSSYYSYLCALMSYAKVATREAKRSGDKIFYEDMVDKKEAIEHMTDAVKQRYNAISRAVTIHIENNNELHMNGGA